MTPELLSLRRESLARAIQSLSPTSFRALLHLALTACPVTRRIWTTPLRAADALGLTAAAADDLLALLVERGFLRMLSRSHGALRCYEIANLLAPMEEAPANLPVESSA